MKQSISLLIVILLQCSSAIFAQKPVIQGLKQKKIHLNKQPYTLEKGFISVPEDYTKVNGRRLTLPVHIYKSPNPSPNEPIFWLNGGPGASNMSDFVIPEFLAHHDVVLVGYRGADGNSVLNSKQVSRAMKGKSHQLLSDESLDAAGQKVKEYLATLPKKGVDITQYTMMQVIEDLEYVRTAIGAPQINLYSVSYGTRVALIYSYQHPEIIKRSIMVGANPPGHFFWFPDKTEQIIGHYDSLYRAQNYPGSIRETIQKAFDNMPKRWFVHKLDPDKIKSMTFALLFSTDGASMAFDAYFRAANKKDYSGLYLLQVFFDYGMSKSMAWGDLYAKGISADLEPGLDYRSRLRAYTQTTTLGPNYGLLLWGLADAWNATLIPEKYRKTQRSETPTLIVSGNLDVSTPADFATEKLLPTLVNGRQVILKDYSHAMTGGYQKAEIRAMMSTYFNTGVVDETAIKYKSVDFKPKKSLNKMAKRGYPLWLIVGWVY